ncbi:MAG: CHAT domain-containing protein [Flavobacteriaceae bacterium]|nr:CHAT domain-containing protein [Flavobacteriaceae bacterium]
MKKSFSLLLYLIFQITFLAAQEQNQEIKELEQTADSLFYDLSTKYSDKIHKQTLSIRKEILTKYSDISTSDYKMALAKMYASKSALLGYNSKYDSAIYYSKKALEVSKKLKKRDLFFDGHVSMQLYGQVAYNGDWKTSLKICEETLQIFKDTLVENHELIAGVQFDIGFVAGALGDYSTRLKKYELSKDIYTSSKGENNHDVALKYYHLAGLYGSMGYSKKELAYYKKAMTIWETINYEDTSYLKIAYGSLTVWYKGYGDIKKAELYTKKNSELLKSKNYFNETFKGRWQVGIWDSKASNYMMKNDLKKALFYNSKSLNYLTNLDINDKRNNPNNVKSIKNWVKGGILLTLRRKASYLQKKHPEKAKEIYIDIIKRKKIVDFNTVPESINLSNYYIKNKKYSKAKGILIDEFSDTINRKTNYQIIQLYAVQATIYNKLDSFIKMDQKYRQVFKRIQKDTVLDIKLNELKHKDCKPFGDSKFIKLLLKTSDDYTIAFEKTGNKEYLKIAHNLNILVSDVFSENYTSLNYNNKTYLKATQVNEKLLKTTLVFNDKAISNKSLQKIEESSSKQSWVKFLNSNQRKHLNIPETVLEKEEGLKKEILFYKKTLFLSNENSEEKKNLWKEKLLELEQELDSLNNWYKNNYASYFNQTQKEFDIIEVKKRLSDNQKIIKYIFTEENLYAFAITNSATNLIKIGNRKTIEENIKPLIKSLTNSNATNFKTEASKIYKLLFLSKIIGNKQSELIFILDDVLHYLPLEILKNKNEKYLIETHAVSYAPSLLLWNEQLQVKKATNNKIGVFAPNYNAKTSNNLLGASNEAQQISKLFSTDTFLGNNASKQNFIKNSKNYNMLHLAMHSNINNENSEFSNLEFSSNDKDNKLYISELYNMSFNADLAVLSACNTAVGNLKKGEGLTTVSKAFTYAGVPSTVTSLWKVPDKETQQIMIFFYKYLKDGKPKNIALQQAKLDYLNSVDDELLKHPYYWAGFVVSGNISEINNTNNTKFVWFLLGGVLFVVIAAKFYKKKRLTAA